jgi:hypothetical protein
MLEDKVRLFSENLARALDRRKFLTGTGTVMFGALAALATGRTALAKQVVTGSSDTGTSDRTPPPWPPQCAPPGPYCNITGTSDASGCMASRPYEPSGSCFQHLYNGQMLQCRIMYGWYQAGCWTTNVAGGRWTCCDCGCSVTGNEPYARLCGCAQFSSSPPPRPDGPARYSDN